MLNAKTPFGRPHLITSKFRLNIKLKLSIVLWTLVKLV